MGTRKNQSSLTPEEKQRFVAAVLQLKANGVYDRYVRQHRDLFNAGIHQSVIFLPWHREFLRRLERDLQAIDPSVNLPYWDWTVDRTTGASLWGNDFMGGNGSPPGGPVPSGPFAFSGGRWPLTVRDSPAEPVELTRALGLSQLPTANQVRSVLGAVPYSLFTRQIEIQVHNTVHVAVGGAAATASSPNDPVFFLLHCNVDRLWAQWRRQHPDQAAFQGDARFGLNSPMPPWEGEAIPPTPASVLDHTALGYTYDTDVPTTNTIVDLTVGAVPLQAGIGAGSEMDWYRFVVPAAGTFTVETEGPTDVVMSLFGPNNQIDLVTEDDDGGAGSNARIASNLSAGTYFVRIRHFQTGGTGSYLISVKGGTAPATIPEITVNGAAVQGSIDAANESDLYSFVATTTGSYTIETSGNTDTFLTLFGPNSQTAFVTQDDDSGPANNSRIVRTLLPGIYYLRVRHYSATGTGGYGIVVTR